MFELFTLARTPIGELCWQLGLFLLVGLTASFALGRRPARAHRVLLLAALAGLATPALSEFARQTGSGLWPGPAVFENRPIGQSYTHANTSASVPALRRDDQVQPSIMWPSTAQVLPPATLLPAREQPILMVRILLGVWIVAGCLALVRVGLSLVFGWRIVSRSRPVCNVVLQRAGELASERIGLGVKPDIRFSKSVHSPVIWCWGRRPVILLSEVSEAEPDQVDWTGVFCHELAHWVRRDHWSSLLGEILVGIVPWNPLAWACRWRLAQLGELACDDWAIACGQEPNDYAETLVRLLPLWRTAPALAAISRRSGLKARINHIIETVGVVDPWPGRIWSGGAALVAVSLAATLALAQAPAMTKSRQRDEPSKLPSPSRNAPPNAQRTIQRTVRGEVRDPKGKPVAGASVFAIGNVQPRPEMIKGQLEYVGERLKVVGQSTADKGGRFQVDLRAGPEVSDIAIVVRGSDSALSAANFSIMADEKGEMRFPPFGPEPISLTLSRSIPIEGRLLSPAGNPVAGARVELVRMESGKRQREHDQWAAPGPESGPDGQPVRLPYWPDAVVSDSQGRFQLGGYSEGTLAEITITHDEYIHEALTIAAASELYQWYTQHNLKPLAPRFTHVLEPSRPIEGTVTDKETGRPIEGVVLDMAVSRPPDWRFHHKATTDASGRYRLRGVGWNHPARLFANVNPAANSGYLPMQENRGEWPAGTRDLVWNFTLRRGQLVRGTVLAAETRKPIAGARIGGGAGAITDPNGNFALSVPPGQQAIFVEGPTPTYQRVRVSRGVASPFYTFFPHGFAKVDTSPGQAVDPLEILLKRGTTITAQAVDPDGKPLSNVWVSGLGLYAELDRPGSTAGRYATGLFQMSSFVPGQTYRIFFIQNERHLAGFADITARAESDKPINVTLRPMASVRGRLQKPDGSPNTRRSIETYLHMVAEDVKLDTMVFLTCDLIMSMGLAAQRGEAGPRTNDQGEFLVAGIVPGARHYLVLLNSSNQVEYLPIDPLQPGEVRNLGAVKSVVLTDTK